ncbi:MAG: hypothetical protein ACE14V_04295 [bacterium]
MTRYTKVLFLLFCFLSMVTGYASSITGNIDVYPAGFIIDHATPFAIHFSCWTSTFIGNITVTAKIQIASDATTVLNYTWSTASGYHAWGDDDDQASSLNPMPISNTTVSGWLFGMSRITTFFGLAPCNIRLYKLGSALPIDISTTVPIYAWNTTSNAGWIEGIFPQFGANRIVLAKNSTGKILGSYITEDNLIAEPDAYPTTPGYIKLAVPVGRIDSLEFRNLTNQVIGTYTGHWTVTAGKVTTIDTPTQVDDFDWKQY